MARLYIPINHHPIAPIHFLGINSGYPFHRALLFLDELLECAVKGRADVRNSEERVREIWDGLARVREANSKSPFTHYQTVRYLYLSQLMNVYKVYETTSLPGGAGPNGGMGWG